MPLAQLQKLDTARLKQITMVAAPLLTLLALAFEISDSYGLINQQTINSAPARPETKPTVSYPSKNIVNAAIFGASNNSSNIKLPKTKLQLTLRGAFTASNPEKASAIIEDSDKQTKHYRVGQAIAQNTILKAVYSDRIVLATNDNLETLYFPETHESDDSEELSSNAGDNSSVADSDAQRQAIIKRRMEELRKRVKRQGQ